METDIELIEKRIGIPAIEWKGRCHEIAHQIYLKDLVPKDSKVRYGLWWGFISQDSVFSNRPFTHHGWIELSDGRIYDPTRFVFFDGEPSIFIGEKNEDYDAGGNRLLESKPRPERKGMVFKLTSSQQNKLRVFIEDGEKGIYLSDCFWLGNLPLDSLNGYAKQIYNVLVELGHKAVIPIDNYEMAQEICETKQDVSGRKNA